MIELLERMEHIQAEAIELDLGGRADILRTRKLVSRDLKKLRFLLDGADLPELLHEPIVNDGLRALHDIVFDRLQIHFDSYHKNVLLLPNEVVAADESPGFLLRVELDALCSMINELNRCSALIGTYVFGDNVCQHPKESEPSQPVKSKGDKNATAKRRPARSPKDLTEKQKTALGMYIKHRGNRTLAAKELGIDESSFRERMEAVSVKMKGMLPNFKRTRSVRMPIDSRGQENISI
ncbi:MAG: hypothetical protein C0483_14140 [Pirellula sp.]|nr:hypothetical protein [Pirellula sp.]